MKVNESQLRGFVKKIINEEIGNNNNLFDAISYIEDCFESCDNNGKGNIFMDVLMELKRYSPKSILKYAKDLHNEFGDEPNM